MTESERIGLHSGIWIALFAIMLVVILRRRNAVGLTAQITRTVSSSCKKGMSSDTIT